MEPKRSSERIATDAKNIRLGIVPLGTGEDFARTLGLAESIEDNIDILARPKQSESISFGLRASAPDIS